MVSNVYARPFNGKDPVEQKLFKEWLYQNRDKNKFDPDVFEKGQVSIMTCFDETGIVMFVPYSVSFVVRSLAPRPGLPRHVRANALRTFQQVLTHIAAQGNVPDAFFYTEEEDLAEGVKKYGWREPEKKLLKLHFASLEPKHADNQKPSL